MNKNIVISAIFGVLLLIVAYWVGKSYGKKLAPKKIDIPEEDISTDGNLNEHHLTAAQVSVIVDRLYKDIKGITLIPASLGGRDVKLYGALIQASDMDFLDIINAWDAKYYSKWKQTLLEAMKSEYYNEISGVTDRIIERISYIEKKYRKR